MQHLRNKLNLKLIGFLRKDVLLIFLYNELYNIHLADNKKALD